MSPTCATTFSADGGRRDDPRTVERPRPDDHRLEPLHGARNPPARTDTHGWFASEDYKHFHWVSSSEARHSANVAARPEVAIAIFDSTVHVGGAQAVYMSGLAEELTGAELEPGIEVFGRLSEDDVGRRWGLDDVRPPSLFRLYRATVLEHYVLIPGRDPELGTGVDRREPVTPA